MEVSRIWARFYGRVLGDFDDDLGAPHREYLRRAIAADVRLGPWEEHTVGFRLPVTWNAPVTTLHGTQLSGVHLLLALWAEADRPLEGGEYLQVEVEPLQSQERVFDACLRLGLRLGDTSVRVGGFRQTFELSDPRRPAARYPRLLWLAADEQRLTVALRDFFTRHTYGEVQLTHDEALREPWEELLVAWLDTVEEGRSAAQSGHGPLGHANG